MHKGGSFSLCPIARIARGGGNGRQWKTDWLGLASFVFLFTTLLDIAYDFEFSWITPPQMCHAISI